MKEKPSILNTETVARSRLFRIEQLDLRFANGVEARYERLSGSARGAVLVVPRLDDDTVLLIREYAAGVDRYELALPKGRIEDGEDVLSAANREMMEEVGYGAHSLHSIASLTLAPGYFSHTTHVVLAEDLYPQHRAGDEPEDIEVVPWRLSQLDRLLAREDVTEARSIAALFMVRERLSHE
ncbi:MAG: ADP compounds hydrolase NudE [Gammaproteobacteria bacterium]|nr:ADP compounds hydrolase NudE [Gammaproteobacteria bacterium]